ncbi:50S ribosomal protein L25 [Bienertia sinuspersici]
MMYCTISNDLLNSIIDPDDKAIDAWARLEIFFHNNKSARALQLDAQFTNTKLENFGGVKPYCTRLKTLADSLKNVGDKFSDNRMALQLLKGLSEEYKPFRTSVRHLNPLPSFDTLCSMLELEEQGNAANITKSYEEAHVSSVSHTTIVSPQIYIQRRGGKGGGGGRKNSKGKGGGGGKGKSGGGGSGKQQQPQQQPRWV